MAVQVRRPKYISLPSSAKQQREITKLNSKLSGEREPRRLIF